MLDSEVDRLTAAAAAGTGVALTPAEVQELARCVRDWRAVANAAVALDDYDPLDEPVVCAGCAPRDPRGLNAARRELHAALQALWAAIHTGR